MKTASVEDRVDRWPVSLSGDDPLISMALAISWGRQYDFMPNYMKEFVSEHQFVETAERHWGELQESLEHYLHGRGYA